MGVHIIGAYQTRFGELWDESLSSLMLEAATGALKDAGLQPEDIGYVVVGSMIAESVVGQGNLGTLMGDLLKIQRPAIRVEGACASGGVAAATAFDVIKAERAENVLVVGVEKMTNLPAPQLATYLMQAASAEIDAPCGLTFPGNFGLVARHYLETYDISDDLLAAASVKAHCNAVDCDVHTFVDAA